MARRKRHDDEHGTGHERWLVSYADFMTLMFAFFAVLYATSSSDVQKMEQLQESIKKFVMKVSVIGGPGGGEQSPAQGSDPVGDAAVVQPIKTDAMKNAQTAEVEDQAAKVIDEKFTAEEKKKIFLAMDADNNGVRLVLNADQIFDTNRAAIRKDAEGSIKKVAELAAQLGKRMLVEGHSRSWELGALRSSSLVKWMLNDKEQLKPDQFVSLSFGPQRPFSSREGQNVERIEIVFLTEDIDL